MVYILFYAVLHKLCLSGRYNKRIIKLAVSGFLSTPDYCCFQKRESDTNPERWCATRQVDNENILIFSAWCFCQAVFMLLTLIVRGIPSA